MNRWRTEYSYAAPAIALHLALVSWTRLHGLVSLELFNQISASADDPGVIYHSEVQVLLREIGFLAPTSS
jgi:3-oxoacyl-ACP reductase-like protein